jgi:hypothetical protein
MERVASVPREVFTGPHKSGILSAVDLARGFLLRLLRAGWRYLIEETIP